MYILFLLVTFVTISLTWSTVEFFCSSPKKKFILCYRDISIKLFFIISNIVTGLYKIIMSILNNCYYEDNVNAYNVNNISIDVAKAELISKTINPSYSLVLNDIKQVNYNICIEYLIKRINDTNINFLVLEKELENMLKKEFNINFYSPLNVLILKNTNFLVVYIPLNKQGEEYCTKQRINRDSHIHIDEVDEFIELDEEGA